MVRLVSIVTHVMLFGLYLKQKEIHTLLRYFACSEMIDFNKTANLASFLNVCLLYTTTALTRAGLFIKERRREIQLRLNWK